MKLHPRKLQCVQAEPCPCRPGQNPTQTTLNPRLQTASGDRLQRVTGQGSGQHFLSTLGLNEDSRKMISPLGPGSGNESPQGSSTAGMPDGPQRHFPESPPVCHDQLTAKKTLVNSGRYWVWVLGGLQEALATHTEGRRWRFPCSHYGS